MEPAQPASAPPPPSSSDPPPPSSSSSPPRMHPPDTTAVPTSSSLVPNPPPATVPIISATVPIIPATVPMIPATVPISASPAPVTSIPAVTGATNAPPPATTSSVPLRPAFPINRNRLQSPYPHFAQHLPSNPSPSLPFSPSSSPSSSPSLASTSSSSSSVSASSASLPSVAASSAFRGGVALGLLAYPPRPQQPATLIPSSFPSPGFGPQPGTLGRMSDPATSASAQARPNIPGVQSIGMMGALSGSQSRPGGIPAHVLPRTGQAPLMQQSPSSSQSMVHQPWISTQGKPVAASVLSSPSYRPQFRPPVTPQRPIISQSPNPAPTAPQQQQAPSSQQPPQQQQQKSQQSTTQSQHAAEYYPPPRMQHPPVQQPQGSRSQGSAQKISPSPNQSSHHGSLPPSVTPESIETSNQVLSKRSIHEVVSQIDPLERLGPEVEDFLVEIVEDFVESTTMGACSLAKHRKSSTLEAKDILLYLERNWGMTLPGYGVDEIKGFKKPHVNDVHKQRMTAIKKSATSTPAVPDTTNTKISAGQVGGNAKGHPVKAPPMASPNT